MSGKLPGHKITFEVNTGTGFEKFTGINNLTFNPERDALEVTEFNSADDARERLMGLKSYTASASGHFTGGIQNSVRAVLDSGAHDDTVTLRILWDGTNGVDIDMIVADYGVDSDLDSPVEVSFSFESTGGITAVS